MNISVYWMFGSGSPRLNGISKESMASGALTRSWRSSEHHGLGVILLVIKKADEPPKIATMQMSVKPNAVIIDNDHKSILCKDVREVMAMIKLLADASTHHKRNANQSRASAMQRQRWTSCAWAGVQMRNTTITSAHR